jgi:hypothetical protein
MSNRKKASAQGDWEVTTERYIAFFDIMGFKDRVARLPHEEIYEMMLSIHNTRKRVQSTKWGGLKTPINKNVRSTFFSDSIVIYSKDASNESCESFLLTVSTMTHDFLSLSIPHKGAIAFGKMSVDFENSIVFGQPLIDAYLLQEELSLYCVVVHSSAEQEMDSQEDIPPFVLTYPCPFKQGTSNHLVITPLFLGVPPNEKEQFRKQQFLMFYGVKNLRFNTSGHLRKYIDNTEQYLKKGRDMLMEAFKS